MAVEEERKVSKETERKGRGKAAGVEEETEGRGGSRRQVAVDLEEDDGASELGGGPHGLAVTLQVADVGPLLLLHDGCLQFGTQGHVIQVVQQDAHHMAREVLQPRHGDHLTELHRRKHRHTQTLKV